MNKTFDYDYQLKPLNCIDVEDIGQCQLKMYNDIGFFWLLQIKTELGDSFIKCFGPIHCDIDNYFPEGFNFEFTKMSYNEKKLSGIIDRYINDHKRMITQVEEIDEEEFNDILDSIDLKEIGENT